MADGGHPGQDAKDQAHADKHGDQTAEDQAAADDRIAVPPASPAPPPEQDPDGNAVHAAGDNDEAIARNKAAVEAAERVAGDRDDDGKADR